MKEQARMWAIEQQNRDSFVVDEEKDVEQKYRQKESKRTLRLMGDIDRQRKRKTKKNVC